MKTKFIYLFAVIASLFFVNSSKAQLKKGNVLIGSNISNINIGLDKGGNFSFQLSPKAAWFTKNNIALGGFVNLGYSTAKDAGSSFSYGIGALARYYFMDEEFSLLRRSRFFMEGTAGLQGDNPAVGDNTNGLGLGFGPGWTYFITENIGLEALFKYDGIIGFGSSVTSNNLALSVGFQIYLPSARVRKVKNDVETDIKQLP